jgi:hypothetical protein
MNAYSMALRHKIVEALSTGTPKARVARAFGVGLSTVKRYAGGAQRDAAKASPPASPPASGTLSPGRIAVMDNL